MGLRLPVPTRQRTGCIAFAKHKNKYSHFSKNQTDPLQIAIERVFESQPPVPSALEGTTIPVANGSNLVPRRKRPSTIENHSRIDPRDPSTYGFFEFGRIIGAHGVKGEVRLDVTADVPEEKALSELILYLQKPGRHAPRAIKSIRMRSQKDNLFILSLEGISNRFMAEALRGYTAFLPQDRRAKLQPDEFLSNDIVGCYCYLQGDKSTKAVAVVIGVVMPEDISVNMEAARALHALLEIRLLGTRNHCLIPFVTDIVPIVDIAKRALFLNPPEGLLELTYLVEEKLVVKAFLPARIERLSPQDRAAMNERATLVHPVGGVHIPFV